MATLKIDLSPEGLARVVLLTALGTLFCICGAFVIDSYSFETGMWRWGSDPVNNAIIPLVLATPFFYLLLSRQRALAIAHKELMVVATTDGLTSCLTRRAFTTLVDAYLDNVATAQGASEGALLVIDVDHFKRINDAFGHDCGDEALKVIAQNIREAVRDVDIVGRLGGEEFSVFLPGAGQSRASAVAERIRTRISDASFVAEGTPCTLTVSVGGAVFDTTISFTELYRRADTELYAAKHNGRNRVEMRSSRGTAEGLVALH